MGFSPTKELQRQYRTQLRAVPSREEAGCLSTAPSHNWLRASPRGRHSLAHALCACTGSPSQRTPVRNGWSVGQHGNECAQDVKSTPALPAPRSRVLHSLRDCPHITVSHQPRGTSDAHPCQCLPILTLTPAPVRTDKYLLSEGTTLSVTLRPVEMGPRRTPLCPQGKPGGPPGLPTQMPHRASPWPNGSLVILSPPKPRSPPLSSSRL